MDMSFEAEWDSLMGTFRRNTPNRGRKPRFAVLRELENNTLAFSFSYSPAIVTDLKRLIPKEHRQWVPEEKHWTVLPEYEETCVELAKKHLGVPFVTKIALS